MFGLVDLTIHCEFRRSPWDESTTSYSAI